MGVDLIQPASGAMCLASTADAAQEQDPYWVPIRTQEIEPRFPKGGMLYVNPKVPLRPDDFALVLLNQRNFGLVVRLIKADDNNLTYQVVKSGALETLAREAINDIHRITGCYTPV